MAKFSELTEAHVILHAVQLASEGDLPGLEKVVRARREVLSDTLIFRLLLSFYPVETADQTTLINFLTSLRQCATESVEDVDTSRLDPATTNLGADEAFRRCQALSLRTIPTHTALQSDSELANFVVHWAKWLESFGGAAQQASGFVEHFVEHDPDLRTWYETYLLPVVRLQYEFYPENDNVIGVQDIEQASGAGGVKMLLQYAEKQHNPAGVARDLDQVVAPWVRGASRRKRRKIDLSTEPASTEEASWETVNEWLISTSVTDFGFAAKAYVKWDGPVDGSGPTDDVAARFAQTGLAIIYGCSESSPEIQAISRQILGKATRLTGQDPPDLSKPEPDIDFSQSRGPDLEEIDLLTNSLPKKSNRFTHVDDFSIQLLVGLLGSATVLTGLGLSWTINDLARTCVFGSERRHKDELRRLLLHVPQQTRKEIDWHSVRRQLLWLQSWTHSSRPEPAGGKPAFFSRLSVEYVETQILDAFLRAGQYSAAKEVYLGATLSPLPASDVEGRVVAAILDAYDNSSNGNRDRGGIKRASDILKAFRPSFPDSSTLPGIEYLVKATHSLSFYQLTLQHGVPFRPVAIRVQKDPLTLVGKVLEQDPKAYTKLDDLLEIGRNLVRAHLPSRGNIQEDSEPLELRVLDAEHRITYLAIMAALTASDFDTAYAYITTRFHSPPVAGPWVPEFSDDTSWRAAYAAGRYRPSTSPKNLGARIDSLVQRMELLSRALMLAPSGEALSGILATWRRYEEELDGLKTQAVEEERAFEAHADASLPGAFGLEDRDADAAETKRALERRSKPGSAGPSYEDEAPLGLFDVARGAATALRKSATLPLGSSGLRDLKIHSTNTQAQHEGYGPPGSPDLDDSGRVRKRDMVANMVTSGLVSGMGWVLGAQPQDRTDYRDASNRS